MRNLCSSVVRAFGGSWTTLGWTLFVIALVIPLIPFVGAFLAPFWLGVRIALGVWWVIDLVDQEMITTYLGGSILLLFVTLLFPPNRPLYIICWLVYMTSVRKRV